MRTKTFNTTQYFVPFHLACFLLVLLSSEIIQSLSLSGFGVMPTVSALSCSVLPDAPSLTVSWAIRWQSKR